jgi:hypothetical protein
VPLRFAGPQRLDRCLDCRLGAESLGGGGEQLRDVGLQLLVGGAVFGVAEAAEQAGVALDADFGGTQVAVGDLMAVQH